MDSLFSELSELILFSLLQRFTPYLLGGILDHRAVYLIKDRGTRVLVLSKCKEPWGGREATSVFTAQWCFYFTKEELN